MKNYEARGKMTAVADGLSLNLLVILISGFIIRCEVWRHLPPHLTAFR